MNSSASYCILLLPLGGRAEQRNTQKEFPMSLLKNHAKSQRKEWDDGWMDG
jgi:hypothetical protein